MNKNEIRDKQFEGTGIENYVIEDYITRIGNRAFKNCLNLKEITLGKGLNSGGSDVFLNSTNLKIVRVKDLNTIFNYYHDNYGSPFLYGAELFLNDVRVREIDIPETPENVYNVMTLMGCSSLRKINMPKSEKYKNEIVKKFNEEINGGTEFKTEIQRDWLKKIRITDDVIYCDESIDINEIFMNE